MRVPVRGREDRLEVDDSPGTSPADGWLWRRYAGVYDALEGLTGYGEMLDAVVAAVGQAQGRRIVEVGCGTGNVLKRLLPAQPTELVGIDASEAMLGRAQDKLGSAITAGQLRLIGTDAVAGLAGIPGGSVDVVIASNVLYALTDRQAFWGEASRVLRPDGRVVLSNPDRPGFGPAVRQQWRTRGVAGFTDLRMIEVFVLNVAIDALAVARRYEFPAWAQLAAEAAEAGLDHATLRGRCYGGPIEGMNIVGELCRS